MANAKKKKVLSYLQALNRRFGHLTHPEFVPPPTSADASAALAVSRKNSEIVAGAVLGLHGPPQQGIDAARKLMGICVDWNEVRVCNSAFLVQALGRDARAEERIALLQRFLEAYFLRERNLNLDSLVNLRGPERRQFISNLEVFSREELAAVLLSCFGHTVFPPSEVIHEVAKENGLITEKTTVLQMAKQFESFLDAQGMLELYSHLYSLAQQPSKPTKSKKSKKKAKATKK